MSKKWIVSFGWNHEGLGHVSRLTEIHSEFIDTKCYESIIFVQHEQEMIRDYEELSQIIIPSYNGALIGDEWWTGKTLGVSKELAETVTKSIIENSLKHKEGIILFDVVIHKELYLFGLLNSWPMYLLIRKRKDMEQFIKKINSENLNINKIFILDDDYEYESKIPIKNISSIIRRRGKKVMWLNNERGINILLSAGGGGHKDALVFLKNSIEAVITYFQGKEIEINLIVNPGPFFNHDIIFNNLPSNIKIILKRYISSQYSQYINTDLIICQGGYNTASELKYYYGKKIVVPGSRSADDQFERVKKLEDHNTFISVNEVEEIVSCLKKIKFDKNLNEIKAFKYFSKGSREILEEIMGES